MSSILLSKSEGDILIFHIWKSLKYGQRLLLSAALILIGLALQIDQVTVFPGGFLIIAGNLILLTKGYDNRLNKAIFKADADWNKISQEQLTEIITLNKKMNAWDLSPVDISNPLGAVLFIVFLIAALVLLVVSTPGLGKESGILLFDLAVLTLPHWFTGIKKISTTPKLVNKIKLIQDLINDKQDILKNHKLEYNILLQGNNEKLPKDVKFRIDINNAPDNFLGVYGQLNMNNIQGHDYPYFYVVLVAKKDFGILPYAKKITPENKIVVETQKGTDVDVIIIRQYTTRTSGYHTKPKDMQRILEKGIIEAEKIIKMN